MDKLQFLDLTDLNPSEEEQLNDILYNVDYPEVVELPPETPPVWLEQHPVQYVVVEPESVSEGEALEDVEQPVDYGTGLHMMAPHIPLQSQCCSNGGTVVVEPEPVNGGESLEDVERPVDCATGSHMMAPHTAVQYTQMMPTPSVYVSNVTANVNVHGFMPARPMACPATAFIPSVDAQMPPARKSRPAKTPTKRSPEVRRSLESPQANYTPPFTQPFPPAIHYPYYYHPMPPHPLQQQIPRPFVGVSPVYPPAATVYSGFPTAVFTPPHHVQHPPSEPHEENPVPYQEEEEEKMEQPVYQQQASEEEEPPVVESVIVENSSLQQTIEEIIPVVEVQLEEAKVEKPLVTKAPPANAFKSAPSLTQKPPFPPPPKQKRSSIDNGPEFVDPPVETGPPKKSYASLFGSGDRTAPPMIQDSAASKPLAKIHPTVHTNTPTSTPGVLPAQENTPAVTFSNPLKERPEIMPDYDINLQRLGEFLTTYQLDHKPLLLQPRGLTNRSNYCYINAILQALIACPPFYNLMKAIPPSQENKNGKSRTPVIDSMVKFVNEFSPMSMTLRPGGRKEKAQATKDGNAVSPEVVTGPSFEPVYVYKMLNMTQTVFPVEGRQEDAEEFLSCLLNGLNDEMLEAMKLIEPQPNGLTNGDVTTNGEPTTNGEHEEDQNDEWTEVVNKNNKSVVTRRAEFGRTPLSAIFRGQMRSRVFRAGVENGTTDNVQPFFTLQLDVEKASSVEKALELLVGKDEVVGSVCPKTNQEISMFTQTSLEELPIILLLHLKCFDYKLHTCSKIIKTVEFPIDLKIDNKLLTSKSKTSTKDRQYKLLAVVYHDGKEATKGHYITDVFHMGYSGWVRYDDATVRPVTQQQVLNPKSPRVPYLLYYRRCDTIGLPLDKNR